MVVVIVTCRRIESLRLATLVFDSIRVGFPTWPITVIENGSIPEAVPVIEDACRKVGATLRRLTTTLRHNEIIEGVLGEANGRVVIVDPDVVFWGDCEGWDFGDALIAGHHQPESVVEGIRYLERLHTALLWVPDAANLREVLHRRTEQQCYPASWTPAEMYIDGQRTICDVGAQVYAAIRDKAGRFGREHLDCYDHIGFSTQPHFLGLLGEHYRRVTTEAHALAETNPAALKGLWRRQSSPTVSWRYYAGIVEGVFLMRAEFTDLMGGEKRVHCVIGNRFWCGADDEDDPAPLHVQPLSAIEWVDGGHILHADGGWSDRRFCPNLNCKVARDGDYVPRASMWAEEEIGNGRYSGWTWAAVTFGDGARYWIYETSAGRWAARGDGTPVSWVTVDNLHRIDGRDLAVADYASLAECHDPIIRVKYHEGTIALPGGGFAIVEKFQPQLRHGFEPLFERWANGNAEAAQFMLAFHNASHLVDDVADGDLKGPGAVSDLLAATLVGWQRLPFYVKNRLFLEPVMLVLLATWACSDTWGASRCRSTQMYGYVFSTSALLMTCAVALLVGGPMNARRALKEMMLFYRREWESFPSWVREREVHDGV